MHAKIIRERRNGRRGGRVRELRVTRTGGHRPVLLVGLFLVRGVSKLIVPIFYRLFVGSKLLIPVLCLGMGGTESDGARNGLIVIFEIVVPILGRIPFERTGMKGSLLFLECAGGSARLINEVIVPVFGHVAWFENTFRKRYPRIRTVEIKILVPILCVAGCEMFSEGNMWVKRRRDGPVSVWTAAAICGGEEHARDTSWSL